MKEYIKLFNDLQSADGYIIEDIPFTTTVKREEVSLEPQNARCNAENKKLKVIDNIVYVVSNATILRLQDGTNIELTGTSITSGMTSAYKSTLVGVEIGNTVTNIGNKAFIYCENLSAITIPDSVTSIGDYAFSECINLSAITIPDSVTSIIGNAFNRCTSLSSVTIGSGVTIINDYVFSECTSLSAITIPSSVTSISVRAFSFCSGLTEITCAATTPPAIFSNTFTSVPTGIPVYVPSGSISAYQNAEYWSTFTNFQAIP